MPEVANRHIIYTLLVTNRLMGKPPETTHFTRGRRRAATCGFSTSMKAARVNSLAIAAGGLQARGRLSFNTGVFGAIEPPKAARRALWDKNQNSKSLSFEKVFEFVPTFVSEANETRRRVIRWHSARDGTENWAQLE